MKKILIVAFALVVCLPWVSAAATCYPTGFNGLTAAVVNPTTTVTGTVDATGCDMGVYYSAGYTGRVEGADISGALYYGVFVNADLGDVEVDVVDSSIHNIGDKPFNGVQRGVAIYYRAYFTGIAKGRIAGNTVEQYQKGGIVTNGPGAYVQILDNIVTGLGPVSFIAQNGIQIGYGANATVMRNTVTGNSYTTASVYTSGGIIVVGGAGYGACPDGNACRYTTQTQIVQNTVINNDIGIWLTNIDEVGNAPTTATNIKVVNNRVSCDKLNNKYYGVGYQAGIADQGYNDKIITNRISGKGYDPKAYPNAWVYGIDADVSFTNKPKVHANK